MAKKTIKINEDLEYNIQTAMEKCEKIIFSTECAGRGFDFRSKNPIDSDQQYMALKNKLIESMEAYFNSAKELLNYLTQVTTVDYNKQQAQRYLQKKFTPTWG